jgi:hypothetical protein
VQVHNTANLVNQYLKILAYGPPGVGKTHFAGSMQSRAKVLGLSAEKGLLSLQNLRNKDGSLMAVDYVHIEKYEDMEEAYAFLHHGKGKGVYGAVFLDSITEIQKSCKDYILERTKKEDMEMRDWGTLAMKIERLVRAFRDLPMHVTVTALEESEIDKSTGEIKVLPALQGSVQKLLPAYFDEVFYLYSKEVGDGDDRRIRHHILTRNSGKYIGKDRSGKLPATMIDPDFGKVYDLILGGKDGSKV